jgi:hypothetical protein
VTCVDATWYPVTSAAPRTRSPGRPVTDLTLAAGEQGRGTSLAAIAFAVAAAVAVKAPSLFGLDIVDDAPFYLRNLSALVLPLLAGYLAWRRRVRPPVLGLAGGVFAFGAAAANGCPFAPGGATELLLAIHLPIVLWFVVGLAYAGVTGARRPGGWTLSGSRASGSSYYALIALGGGVLVAISIRTRGPIAALERWQTTYLPVLAAWVTLVALALPPIFGFV